MDVKTLLNNKDFLNEIESVEDITELKDKFQQYGVTITDEQMEGLVAATFSDLSTDSQNELDENLLENVSGGASLKQAIKACVNAWKTGWKLGKAFYEWEQSLYN